MLRQDHQFFSCNKPGALSVRLATSPTLVAKVIGGSDQARAVRSILVITSTAVLMLFVGSPQLALIFLGIMLLLGIIAMLQNHIFTTSEKCRQDSLVKSGQVFSEAVMNPTLIKSQNLTEYVCQQYAEMLEEPRKVNLRNAHGLALVVSLSAITYFSMFYGVSFVYGAKLVNDGSTTFGQFYRTIIIMLILDKCLDDLMTLVINFSKCITAARELLTVVDRKPRIDSSSTAGITTIDLKGKIEFKNVCFGYNVDYSILNEVSFVIKPGECIGICGPSGCGKSTIIKLLNRFYDPVKGNIFFDDIDATKYNAQWLRSQIGWVSQDPVLFHKTIYENIQCGNLKAQDHDVYNAAKLANAHEFIMQLPDMYDTLMSHLCNISGGQRQRIAIARTLLKNAKILLLHEATAALDSESEALVQQQHALLQHNITTITVAHRISTIKHSDKIYYVSHNGYITESGTHHELMSRKESYFQLVKNS